MRYVAFAVCFALGFILTTRGTLAAGFGAGHSSGMPSAGSHAFGRTGGTAPINSPTSANTAAPSSSPISTSSPSSSTGPSGSGTTGSPTGAGTIGTGSFNNEPYPMSAPQGGGVAPNNGAPAAQATNGAQSNSNQNTNQVDTNNPFGTSPGASIPATPNAVGAQAVTPGTQGAAGATGNTANAGANRDIRLHEGRWWHPLPSGQWTYWDPASSSWVYFVVKNGEVANNAEKPGQYRSGYRGLENATGNNGVSANTNANVNGTSPAVSTGWHWRSGQWMWFDGQTFIPAR